MRATTWLLVTNPVSLEEDQAQLVAQSRLDLLDPQQAIQAIQGPSSGDVPPSSARSEMISGTGRASAIRQAFETLVLFYLGEQWFQEGAETFTQALGRW